ncbi:hypothetical protein [Sphingobium tyrosinilyticum]|uniref:Transposase n=1 Tax=Sphingobium tyrosinilyticum TaxID=2715436 RepID=A0ABV9F5C7_9SPHN
MSEALVATLTLDADMFEASHLTPPRTWRLTLWMTPGGSGPDDDGGFADLRRVVGALAAQVKSLQEAVDRLTSENAELKAENLALKDEIARLKGLPPRPKFKAKPSGMEQATSKPKSKKGRKRGRGSVRDKLVVTSEVKLKADAPAGSRFRGYEEPEPRSWQSKEARDLPRDSCRSPNRRARCLTGFSP